MKKEHLLFVDLIRIFSFMGILMVHVSRVIYENYGNVDDFRWLIAMGLTFFNRYGTPLFIMISGYLLLGSRSVENIKEFYIRRLKKILIPIIFWNVFYYWLWCRIDGSGLNMGDFYQRVISGGTYYHLYFMFLIAGLYAITPLLAKMINSKFLGLIIFCLIIISFIYLLGYSHFSLPRINNIFLWFLPYIGYYLAGYWVGRSKITVNYWFGGVMVLILLITGVIANTVLIPIYGLDDAGTFMSNRLSITVAGASLLLFLMIKDMKNEWFKKMGGERIKLIGELGMGLYLIHPAIIEIFKHESHFYSLSMDAPIRWMGITYILTLVLSAGCVWLIKKIPILNRIF